MKHGELPLGDERRKTYRLNTTKHYRLTAMHEWPMLDQLQLMDDDHKAASFFREYVIPSPDFSHEVESLYVFCLNVRRRCTGFFKVASGTQDTLLVHPREVFRGAIIANAYGIVICHNHPSGDSTPSESDVKITRDLIKAGQVLKLEVIDHVVIGNPGHASLRNLGYFYS